MNIFRPLTNNYLHLNIGLLLRRVEPSILLMSFNNMKDKIKNDKPLEIL